MFVNKIKLNRKNITGDTLTMPITIKQNNGFIGQTDILNNEFVNIEKEKNTNDIIDYEKVRFLPSLNSGLIADTIEFKLFFLPDNSYGNTVPPKSSLPDFFHTNNKWSEIGFTQEDITYRRNRFKKSFLRLSFYETDEILSQQRPIFVTTLFPQIFGNELLVTDDIKFKRQNPIVKPNGFAEGYYIYFYKDLVNLNLTYDLYMKAEFLNAFDGKIRTFMMSSPVLDYGVEFIDKTQLRINLLKTNSNYLYNIDLSNGNVTENNTDKKITIDLYQIKVN